MRKPKHQQPTGDRIALYVRVSAEEQADNPEGSIKSQEQRLRAHVEYRNQMEGYGEIADVYIDRAKSGKDTNRAELQRMLTAIQRREITHVLVTELSRLSRNIRDFLEMWALMERSGCQFQSLREQVDTSTAAGRMVIHSMMNFAQFEREQTAERVTANLAARSARGLYNGGIVPVGYKTVPGKKGYLEIDEEVAPTIRAAFAAYRKEETLTRAATWLNKNGYRVMKQMRGGGGKPRLGHFTVDNLQFILRNKAYAGIKAHKVKGEVKEFKAVWAPIVDPVLFDRVQKLLTKNHSAKKPPSPKRHPYLLTGIVYCGTCGDRLCGKSANGNGGKIPYYEHAWSTKKQACLVKKVFDCKPNRILANKLEPLVWEKAEALLRNPKLAGQLIEEAQANQKRRSETDEAVKAKEKIQAMTRQLEALAERIATLPQSVGAEPFYKQMEKIQELRTHEEERIKLLEPKTKDVPVEFSTYESFLMALNSFADDPVIQENRAKILARLIHKIEITPDTFRLHFNIGKNYIEKELAHAGSLFQGPKTGAHTKKAGPAFAGPARSFPNSSFTFSGSNSLTNGWGARIRT